MNDFFHKYFNGELTEKERDFFLLSVNQNAQLKKEFIEIQNILAIYSMSDRKEDAENVHISLSKFRNEKDNTIIK